MASSSEIPSLYHYRFGIFELDGRSRELRRNGVKLKLQDQPYQVLLKLLEHAGQVVGRDELRSALWAADTFVDFETGLNTTIRRLRETLGDSAENPTFIETIPKRGYRFLAPVSTLDSVPPSIADRIQIDAGKSKLRIALRLGIVPSLTGLFAGCSLKHRTAPARPPEKLLNFAQLTNDGQAKVGPLLTDGSRIYFSEVLPSGRVMVQVSTRGGEMISLPTSLSDPRPVDISPDGTELLVLSGKELAAKEHAIGVGLWIVPVAGGSARPVGDVLAMDAIWNTDNKKILYSEGHDIYLVNRDGSN